MIGVIHQENDIQWEKETTEHCQEHWRSSAPFNCAEYAGIGKRDKTLTNEKKN